MAIKRKGNQMVQVVLLRHILRRFGNAARKTVGIVGFGALGKKWPYWRLGCEKEGQYQYKYKSSCSTSALPSDVPKGHFAVYVGKERNRFIIPTTYLNHHIFRALLQKAEHEFGFDQQMGLTIPCQQAVFEYLTSLLGNNHDISSQLSNVQLDELLDSHCIS